MSFANLSLIDPLLQLLDEQGYHQPTPIQQQVIPPILAGKDIMAAAQTGTGKTAGFALPLLQKLSTGRPVQANSVKLLILVPTRELAIQVADNIRTYARYLVVTSEAVYGGVKINPQMMRLRCGIDVLIATPGRLMDLQSRNAINFNSLEYLVLDEADRMLDLGFLPDMQKIIASVPKNRQTLLFSATFSEPIKQLAKQFLSRPVTIQVSPANSAAQSVKQWLYTVDKKNKTDLLLHLIKQQSWHKLLIFVNTKKGADKLSASLRKHNFKSAALHGDKTQSERTRGLQAFKDNKINLLVATDVAARGLDIESLPQVINFDLPKVAEDYIHRIGRTGRAGETGQAISLVCADEVDNLEKIECLILQLIVRKEVAEFSAEHRVPETRLKSTKAKKPHKKKRAKTAQLVDPTIESNSDLKNLKIRPGLNLSSTSKSESQKSNNAKSNRSKKSSNGKQRNK